MPDAPKMDPMLREIFRVAYAYRKKYQHPTGDPAFWTAAANEMCYWVNKCGHHPFARGIMLACYEDIEREYFTTRRKSG